MATTFGLKLTTRIGYWNVRTLYQVGKLRQLAAETVRYNLEILGVSEARWNQFGEAKVADNITFLYSGKPNEEDEHRNGVGMLLSQKAKKSLMDWTPVSERIMVARFRGKVRNVSIVQSYAPTEQAELETKDQFYSQLQRTLNGINKRDILIVMGDLNAKIGRDNVGLEQVIGNHGLGQRNDNGDRFIDFCAQNDLIIGGTIFPHRNCHKVSWISPDCSTENQIDHFAISRKWRKSLTDVRNKRGADIGSDHHLMVANVRIKISANMQKADRANRRFEIGKLKDRQVKEQFEIEVKNRYEILQLHECEVRGETVEEKWDKVKEMYLGASEKVLGFQKVGKKEWMSDATWNKIEERRQMKAKIIESKTRGRKRELQEQYRVMDLRVKRSARADRRTWVSELAERAEKAARDRNMKEVYESTKKLARRRSVRTHPVKDKNGKLLTNEKDQLKRWQEHFTSIYANTDEVRRADQDVDIDVDIGRDEQREQNENININTNCPTEEEIKSALKELKSWKSPGIDNVSPEVLKAVPDISVEVLHHLFKKIWDEGVVPMEWRTGLLHVLPKKGDLSKCDNWRGITLLSIPSKVFARILLNRIKEFVESKLRKEQAGFRKNRSCVDQINTLRIILEQSHELNTGLYMIFIDFMKAFDSIHREDIWKAMEQIGIPRKILSLCQELYRNCQCKVVLNGNLSEPVRVSTGVKQGCVLSPTLFLILMDQVMRKAMEGKQRGIGWGLTGRLENLSFADDVCLLSHSYEQMRGKLLDLEENGAEVGLRININKTKSMRVNTRNLRNFRVGQEGKEIEDTETFTYLGSIVTRDGGADEDVKARIRKANSAFIQLYPVWKAREISQKTKLRLFNSNVKSVLFYGCETWKVTQSITKKLQVFVNRCLRRIFKIYWPEVISNETLWQRANEEEIGKQIKRRKWNWIGHTLRKGPDAVEREAMEWNPQGNRRRGRPRITWRRAVEGEALRAGKTWREVKALAANRVRWRFFVEALCSG